MRDAAKCILISVVILAPTAFAQGPHQPFLHSQTETAPLLQPLETVTQATNNIVNLTITEARRDLTPDQAQHQVRLLQEFVEGLDQRRTDWPNASQANLAEHAYTIAVRIATLTQGIPEAVSNVIQYRSFCESWNTNSTLVERSQWATRAWPALLQVNATATAIETIAQDNLPVDPRPLHDAVAQLRSFAEDDSPILIQCLPPPSLLFFQVIPDTTYRTGNITMIAAVGGRAAGEGVRVTSPTLQLDRVLEEIGTGIHLSNHTIPLGATFGNHTIAAQAAGQTAQANITVTILPTTLELSYPRRVTTGESWSLHARVTGVAAQHLGNGPLRIQGDLNRTGSLTNASATFDFTAPETPRIAQGTVRYPGSPVHATSQTTYRIQFHEPGAAPEERSLTTADVGLPENVFSLFLLLGPITFALFFLVQFADLRIRGRRRNTFQRMETESTTWLEGARGEIPTFHPSILPGLTSLIQSLVRRGHAKPSHTVREAAQQLRQFGSNPEPVVSAFERIRYGGDAEPPRLARLIPRWARTLWQRIRRKEP